jgi:hypothetical protein
MKPVRWICNTLYCEVRIQILLYWPFRTKDHILKQGQNFKCTGQKASNSTRSGYKSLQETHSYGTILKFKTLGTKNKNLQNATFRQKFRFVQRNTKNLLETVSEKLDIIVAFRIRINLHYSDGSAMKAHGSGSGLICSFLIY